MTLRFKLDENPPKRVDPALRALGHDVETAISESLAGAIDLLAACRAEARILITLLIRRKFLPDQKEPWRPDRVADLLD